jgi:hypothetical protein
LIDSFVGLLRSAYRPVTRRFLSAIRSGDDEER